MSDTRRFRPSHARNRREIVGESLAFSLVVERLGDALRQAEMLVATFRVLPDARRPGARFVRATEVISRHPLALAELQAALGVALSALDSRGHAVNAREKPVADGEILVRAVRTPAPVPERRMAESN